MLKQLSALILFLALLSTLSTSGALNDSSTSVVKPNLGKFRVVREEPVFGRDYGKPPFFINNTTLAVFSLPKNNSDTIKIQLCDIETGLIQTSRTLPFKTLTMDIDHVGDNIVIINQAKGTLDFYNIDLEHIKTVTLSHSVNTGIELAYSIFSKDGAAVMYFSEQEELIFEDINTGEILFSDKKYLEPQEEKVVFKFHLPVSKNYFLLQAGKSEHLYISERTYSLINLRTGIAEQEFQNELFAAETTAGYLLYFGLKNYPYPGVSPNSTSDYVGSNNSDALLVKEENNKVVTQLITAPEGFETSNILVGRDSDFILYISSVDNKGALTTSNGRAFALRNPQGGITYYDLPSDISPKDFEDFLFADFYSRALSPGGTKIVTSEGDYLRIYDIKDKHFYEIPLSEPSSSAAVS